MQLVTSEELSRRAFDMFVAAAGRDDGIGKAIREGLREGLLKRMDDLRMRLGIPHVPEDLQ